MSVLVSALLVTPALAAQDPAVTSTGSGWVPASASANTAAVANSVPAHATKKAVNTAKKTVVKAKSESTTKPKTVKVKPHTATH